MNQFTKFTKLNHKLNHRTFITIVNQAEIAYREFLGTNRTQLNPGIHIKVPFLHKLQRVNMRECCSQ